MIMALMNCLLALESSCDDTSLCVLNENYEILYEQTLSHIEISQVYSGVVPESVSREHLKALIPLMEGLLKHDLFKEIKAIAYTAGPGLAGSLLVGSSFAHSLSLILNLPLIPIHHLKGHYYAYLLERKKLFEKKALSLIVSGGHTMLLEITPEQQFTILGQTRDDAAGEVFDKVAKHLKLGYPGGPKISQLAQKGQPTYPLTQPMIREKNLEMSFSGLKSQTIRAWENSPDKIEDLCHSFEQTITETLMKKVRWAFEKNEASHFVLAGGVAANRTLREKISKVCEKFNAEFIAPSPKYCTDNAAMIAASAIGQFFGPKQSKKDLDLEKDDTEQEFFVRPRWSIEAP